MRFNNLTSSKIVILTGLHIDLFYTFFSSVWDTPIQWRSQHSSLPYRGKTFDRSLPAAATVQHGQPPLHWWKAQVQSYSIWAQNYSRMNKNDRAVFLFTGRWLWTCSAGPSPGRPSPVQHSEGLQPWRPQRASQSAVPLLWSHVQILEAAQSGHQESSMFNVSSL